MILSRRKAHFYLVSALCGIVPLVAIAALILRPTVPLSDADALFTAAKFAESDKSETLSELKDLSIKNLLVSARTIKRADGNTYLELQPQDTLISSDILVYWLPAEANPESIDQTARLLGKLSGTSRRQFPLSPDLIDSSGQLLFYSQGQQQTIAAVPFSTSSSQ